MSYHTEHDYRRLGRVYDLAVRTGLYRHFKIARGIWRTWVRPGGSTAYRPDTWWNQYYEGAEFSDATTIEPGKDPLPTWYHYNSVENLILKYLVNQGRRLDGDAVVDVGSGSGHWLRFYRRLGAARLTGFEISEPAAAGLERQFADDPAVQIVQGDVAAAELPSDLDLVNAIGVLFHVVDDRKHEAIVRRLGQGLKRGGLMVVGGHFGWLNNVNVQFDAEGKVNKRLRSARRWRSLLRDFERVEIFRNRAYRGLRATLPENHVLIARR